MEARTSLLSIQTNHPASEWKNQTGRFSRLPLSSDDEKDDDYFGSEEEPLTPPHSLLFTSLLGAFEEKRLGEREIRRGDK